MSTARKTPVSLVLSAVVCCLCLLAIPPLLLVMPGAVSDYLYEHEPALLEHIALILTVYYIAITIAAAVLVLLLCLLRVTYRGRIFTPVSGRLVYAIAMLVIAEGGAIAVLGTVYPPALALTVVAVTMGLCFLVVGHVLREAALIKAENDATI